MTSSNPGASLRANQLHILWALVTYIDREGIPPTRRELAEMVGKSLGDCIQYPLHALERRGLIEIKPGVSRGLIVTSQGRALIPGRRQQRQREEQPT